MSLWRNAYGAAARIAEPVAGCEHQFADACPDDSTRVRRSSWRPAELITRHQHGVWRYLRMLGCDDATADDLTQETFLRVLRREGFVQHNDAATSGYLRRTAYNLLVSRHRKLGRVQTVAEPAVLDEIWERWAGKDLSGDHADRCPARLSRDADRSRTNGITNEICRGCEPSGNRRGTRNYRSRGTKFNATRKTSTSPVRRGKAKAG